MKTRYKITISNKNIYKEFELASDLNSARIGTEVDCDFRIRKDLFFEPVCLTLTKKNDKWIIMCSDNLYISTGDVRKLITKELSHGDNLLIKYQSSNNDLFNFEFNIDFNDGNIKYERAFDISNQNNITIGTSNSSSIVLRSGYTNNESLVLTRKGSGFSLKINKTFNGVYHNGRLAKSGEIINNGDFLSVSDCFFYFKDNKLWTEKGNLVSSSTINFTDSIDIGNYPKFNRNTRLKNIIVDEPITVLDPPKKPEKPKGNIVMQLMPALVMIALTVGIRGFMGNSSNMSFILFSVCSMGMGICTSIYSIIHERKQYKKDIEERERCYKDYITRKRKEIEELRKDEATRLKNIFISSDEEVNNVISFSPDLFDKTRNDEDFLTVRLGIGSKPAIRQINYKKKEQLQDLEGLEAIPEKLYEEYKIISDVPIVTNLNDQSVLGVIGNNDQILNIVKSITLDICSRHYSEDVKLGFLVDPDDIERYSWTKWLPHCNNNNRFRNIVCSSESKNAFFEFLYITFGERAADSKNPNYPHYVIFVLKDWGIKTHPLSQYIEKANDLNATFIFCENLRENLPLGCQDIIFMEDTNAGYVLNSQSMNNKEYFKFDVVSDKMFNELAFMMSPIYCESINLENALTTSITFYELMNILSPDDLDLNKRWSDSEIHKTMSAPIGVKTQDEYVYLDLHEKYHGPHGLVAGTTGSGKSEILQTYILSMATLFHPYEVGFVIIDFKGGGMVNQFKELPHLMGAITNIDGHEINRSLMSIKAELQKRQRLFAEYDVNNINNYIKLYKRGKTNTPIPHLILIVDEFAELKAEQPEFMKELISAARIGRSLGVHLILATQKPAGQVNEQIWSNSKFKLCLKVQTKEDSNEVIKSPLAAEIKEPGRAYLQVGNNELFELFQSAYSGAPAQNNEVKVQEYSINELDFSGRRMNVYSQTKAKSEGVDETQLDAVVGYISQYCKTSSIRSLPDICLPPLAEEINYCMSKYEGNGIVIPLGIYDDPTCQTQDVARMNLSEGHLAIIGSSQYGKTNLIQLMIRSAADNYSPNDLNIYILDFASMALRVFGELNHIGGVVIPSEDERIKHFFRMISTEIKNRKNKFAKLGITSYNSYREAGYNDIPHILVFVDNFLSLKELYPEYEDSILLLLREGISLGITMVISALQSNGIGYKFLSNFANKICLTCNQAEEYSNAFDRCRMEPRPYPGRGLIQLEKIVYEYQTYLAFKGEREIDRVNEIQMFIKQKNQEYKGLTAKSIPSVPAVLDKKYVGDNYRETIPYVVPVGIDYDKVDFVTIDLLKSYTIGIMGRAKSGRTNFVSILIDYLYNHIFDFPAKVYMFDDYEKQLQQFSSYGFVEKYTVDLMELEFVLKEVEEELKDRRDKVSQNGIESLKDVPLLVVVIQDSMLFENNGVPTAVSDTYKRILNTYKAFKVLFVFSNIPNVNISYSAPEMLKQVKNINMVYSFEDISNIKIFDFNATTARKYKKPIELGDAYAISVDGSVDKMKTIKNE